MSNLVPQFILDNFRQNRQSGSFSAVCLFADISGFTPITEKLMEGGSEGAELLSEILKKLFNATVSTVYKSGGFITNFAGDSFTALYILKNNSFQIEIPLAAASQILKDFHKNKNQKTRFGKFEFNVKIGLAKGVVDWSIIGDNFKSFYFKGDAIDSGVKGQNLAEPNEIIIDENFLKSCHVPPNSVSNAGKGFYRMKESYYQGKNYYPPIKISSLPNVAAQIFSRQFVPDILLNKKTKGEFRDVAAAFVSFSEYEDKKCLNEFLTILINLIDKYSGYLKDIDFGDKGGVAACYFGVPSSEENEIRNSCEFLQELFEIIPLTPSLDKLKLRAGITYGKVYAGMVGGEERTQFSVLGNVVNLAARCMSKANWGEIWASENIYLDLKNIFQFEPLGKFNFKGINEPLSIFKLTSQRVSVPAPQLKSVMVGRGNELIKLKEKANQIIKGHNSGIVYIYGEAGIGKSLLLSEFKTEILNNANVIWLYSNADKKLMQSFYLFKNLLSNYFEIDNNLSDRENENNFNVKIAWIKKGLSEFTPQNTNSEYALNELERTENLLKYFLHLPFNKAGIEQLEPKLLHENIIFSLCNFILALNILKPVILAADDAQWLDSDSIELLKLILRNSRNLPQLFIFAGRYGAGERKFYLKLDEEITQESLLLGPLSKEHTGELIKNSLEADIESGFVKYLHTKSGGNPLFIEHILFDLKSRGLLIRNKGTYGVSEYRLKQEQLTPSSLKSMILSRFDILSADLKDVLKAASVLGNQFDIQILREMNPEVKDLGLILSQAVQEKIISKLRGTRYEFSHILMRETIYGMQLKKHLRELHLQAAISFEKIYGKKLTRLSDTYLYHYSIGYGIVNENNKLTITKEQMRNNQLMPVLEKYAALIREQADRYRREYKNETALELYERLVKLSGLMNKSEEAFELLLKQSEILNLTGKWKESEKAVKKALFLARKLKNRTLFEQANKELGIVYVCLNKYDAALNLFKASMEYFKSVHHRKEIMELCGCIGKAFMEKGEYEQALSFFVMQSNLAKRLNNKNFILSSANNIGSIYRRKAEYEKALKCFNNNFKLLKNFRDKINTAETALNIGGIYYFKSDYKNALASFKKSLRIYDSLGDKKNYCRALGNIGSVYFAKQDYKNSLICYEQSLKIYNMLNDLSGMAGAYGKIGNLQSFTGDFENAISNFRKQLNINTLLKRKQSLSYSHGNLGLAYSYMGSYKKALIYMKKQLTLDRMLNNTEGIARAYLNMGGVYQDLNNLYKAKTNYEKAANISRKAGINNNLILALYNLAEVLFKMKKFDEALKYNAESFRLAESSGVKYDIIKRKALNDKIRIYSYLEKLTTRSDSKRNEIKQSLYVHYNNLKAAMNSLDDAEFRADIAGDIYNINNLFSKYSFRTKSIELYKDIALKNYRMLYNKTSRAYILNKIKNLSA